LFTSNTLAHDPGNGYALDPPAIAALLGGVTQPLSLRQVP